MKKLFIATLLSLALFLNPVSAQVETPEPPLTVQTEFFGSVSSYFTSFNTNFAGIWETHRGTLWLGQDFQGGAHASTSLGLEYIVYKNFSLDSETRFEDVTGNVSTQQFGIGYNVHVTDVRITGFVAASVDMRQEDVGCVIGLRAKKLLTENTFAFTELAVPVQKNGSRPRLGLGAGFLF